MVSTPPDNSRQEELERRSRELFQDSVERLDARTRSRLTQARHAALAELSQPPMRRYWLGIPLGAVAAAALVAVLLTHSGRENQMRSEAGVLTLDDLDIVADADNMEMLQNVEFYTWLADEAVDPAG